MEDLFDLAISKKEDDFVNYGLGLELDVSVNILEVLYDIPYIGSLIKLGRIGNKFQELHFIRKLSHFLEKEKDIPLHKKERFLASINLNERKLISEYLIHYLLRAEDDRKADIMGYIYTERVYGHLDNDMLLRLCSIIDKIFIPDLKLLPNYIEKSTENSIAVNNFINLGIIDNYAGGYWLDEPTYKLNKVGTYLYDILNKNKWFA